MPRRMGRRRRLPRLLLLNAVTSASMVLCVVTVVLWVRSHWYVTILDRVSGPPEGHGISLYRGDLTLAQIHQPNSPRGWLFVDERFNGPHPPKRSITVIPGIERGGKPGYSQYVSISLAYPLAALAVLPAIRASRALRAGRRSADDVCPVCGYDLRATPARCPECGTTPT
jgi:hypothetical protein